MTKPEARAAIDELQTELATKQALLAKMKATTHAAIKKAKGECAAIYAKMRELKGAK